MKKSNTTQFEAGKTYIMHWIGDSELKTPVEVLKRTAKTVTVKVQGYDVSRCKIFNSNGEREICYPLGRYSMAPSISSTRF